MSTGMMFPKTPTKKARMRHAKHSILQRDRDRNRCWLCMRMRRDYSEHASGSLHKHHVYMGPLRRISEAEGFFVWLCPQHHETGPEAVHANARVCEELQEEMQEAYERTHTREEFMALTGRSYMRE